MRSEIITSTSSMALRVPPAGDAKTSTLAAGVSRARMDDESLATLDPTRPASRIVSGPSRSEAKASEAASSTCCHRALKPVPDASSTPADLASWTAASSRSAISPRSTTVLASPNDRIDSMKSSIPIGAPSGGSAAVAKIVGRAMPSASSDSTRSDRICSTSSSATRSMWLSTKRNRSA